jgi:hypothetical protein
MSSRSLYNSVSLIMRWANSANGPNGSQRMKGLDLNRDRKSQINEKEKVQFKTLDNQHVHSIKSTQNQTYQSNPDLPLVLDALHQVQRRFHKPKHNM